MSSLVSRLLPQARLLQRSAAAAASELHTSAPALGSLAMPDRLKHIPEAEDPGFFEMVEYFFHKSCVLGEESLMGELSNLRDLSDDAKRQKVRFYIVDFDAPYQ